MKNILFIKSSPRQDDSLTNQVALQAIKKLKEYEEVHIDTLDLWQTQLPELDESLLSAKYAIFSGATLTPEQNAIWNSLNTHIERFAKADIVIVAAPIWNWGIPYKLKHYVDVVTQPGLTFTWSPESGYTPVLEKRHALLITSSGGDYTQGSGNEHEDFAIKYTQLWLQSCMGCELNTINMTLSATGEEAIAKSFAQAHETIAQFCEHLAPVEA